MHVKAQLQQYEKIEFAITLRAPVDDWRAALKQARELGVRAWPLCGLVACIEKMLGDLDHTHADVLIKDDQIGGVQQ